MRSHIAVFLLLGALAAGGGCESPETVGPSGENRVVLPVNQTLTPAGNQVELPGMRPQVIALSAGGELLVTSGKTEEVVVLDPSTGVVLSRCPLPTRSVGDEDDFDIFEERKNEPTVTFEDFVKDLKRDRRI